MDEIFRTFMISASGMRAQGTRLRVIAENLANVSSEATQPGGDPYRRKVVTFKNILDRTSGVDLVEAGKSQPDRSEFGSRFDPSHPAANEQGYVKTPNVNSLIELMDMREAQRSYEANLNVIKSAQTMARQTLQLLR
jgi:flagellar basal-body rod protein FlgC